MARSLALVVAVATRSRAGSGRWIGAPCHPAAGSGFAWRLGDKPVACACADDAVARMNAAAAVTTSAQVHRRQCVDAIVTPCRYPIDASRGRDVWPGPGAIAS
jgi:hypothetical protein